MRYEISTNLKLGILADFMWTRLCIPSPSADFSKSEKVRRTNQINTISGAMAMYIWKAKVEGFLFKSMRERRIRISTNWNFFNSNDQRLGLKDGHWWLDKCENLMRLFNLLRYCSQELGRQVLNPSKKQLGTTTELNKQHVRLTLHVQLNCALQDMIYKKFYPTRLSTSIVVLRWLK